MSPVPITFEPIKPTPEGWYLPNGARRLHYFDHGVSLCKRWKREVFYPAPRDTVEECVACADLFDAACYDTCSTCGFVFGCYCHEMEAKP